MNIANHMVRAGLVFGDSPAMAEGKKVLFNYRTLASRVACLAGAFANEWGLKKGDRVAVVLHNCVEYIELLYACWHCGLVVVPVNAKLHRNDFSYILKNSGASVCFTSMKLRQSIASIADFDVEKLVDVGSDAYQSLLHHVPVQQPVCCAGEDPAWIFYTSGTTGRPKGAVLSHRSLASMSQCYFSDVDREAPWQTMLHAAPMSHGSGLYALAHVIQGSCHVIPGSGGFDPAEIFQLIEHWPNVAFFAAPTMVKRLVECPSNRDMTNLKVIIYGGGPMYVDDLHAGLKRFGPRFAQLYGQGESPMTISAMSAQVHANKDHPRWLERLESVGFPQTTVEVKIASEDGTHLPAGEVGEIIVRGDAIMNGYWQDPEATAHAIRDGWLFTGDYGVFDSDGFLTLKGRAKDVIISGGTNIYPREVEEILVGHSSVSEVSVIGRADRDWGEAVVAYIVPAEGKTFDEESLEAYCLENMARFKRPKYYRSLASLPKNNYGKVLKTELRELETRHYAGE